MVVGREKTTSGIRKKDTQRNIGVNLLGMITAFGIAAGGLLGVRYWIAQEQAKLMQGGGEVHVLVQGEDMEVQDTLKEGRKELSETQLVWAVEGLKDKTEANLHEPQQGQLSMAQAIEYGKRWMEEFFMPHFGISDYGLEEYKANCYLWSQKTQRKENENASCSYWTIVFGSKDLEAELVLHAESGQVLDASVKYLCSGQNLNVVDMNVFLQDYADTFHLGENTHFSVDWMQTSEDNGSAMYRSIGNEGVYAALKASLMIICGGDAGVNSTEYMEIVHIQLSLDTIVQEYVPNE